MSAPARCCSAMPQVTGGRLRRRRDLCRCRYAGGPGRVAGGGAMSDTAANLRANFRCWRQRRNCITSTARPRPRSTVRRWTPWCATKPAAAPMCARHLSPGRSRRPALRAGAAERRASSMPHRRRDRVHLGRHGIAQPRRPCLRQHACKAGDRVLVSVAEHHSNFVPWQMLRDRCGIELALIRSAPTGGSIWPPAGTAGRSRRLVAVTQCSNVTGAWTDVAAIVAAARKVGARVLLDGAQAVQHGPQDVRALGVDFYAFSGHKCFGPGGVGVLWGRAKLLAAHAALPRRRRHDRRGDASMPAPGPRRRNVSRPARRRSPRPSASPPRWTG
jgi:hypothetical protein